MRKLSLFLVAAFYFGCGGFSPLSQVSSSSTASSVGYGRAPSGTFNPGASQLSQTHLFTDTTALTPNPGLVEYSVNMPLWSDGASKRRWMAVPDNTQITAMANDKWSFPPGTVFVKHFEMTMADGSVKRIETRVLVASQNGWSGYDYQWNDAGTDATLLTYGANVSLQIADPNKPGQTLIYSYAFPVGQCNICHNGNAGYALGVNTLNLNGAFVSNNGINAGGNQLTTWSQQNLFTTPMTQPSSLPSYPHWKDSSASVADEARAYLAVNCAHCHQPGGPSGQNFDLRYATPLASANVVGIAPSISLSLGTGEARIDAGNPAMSDIFARMSSTTTTRMPLFGSGIPDQTALTLISNWITSL